MGGPRRLTDVIADVDLALRSGSALSSVPFRTGFELLDSALGGGIRPGELVLVGGAQGLGKTVLALQMARNIAAAGGDAIYLCYEHSERVLLERLIALEAGLLADDTGEEPPTLQQISAALTSGAYGHREIGEELRHLPLAAEAMRRLTNFGERLTLVAASGRSTGVAEIRALTSGIADGGVLFVDYLQKVGTTALDGLGEDERVTLVIEALKDIAIDFTVPVVAIAASDKDGLGEGRTRLRHLRGSTALAYECDVALMLNDKWHSVARHHLMFDSVNAEQYHDWVVCTIEKNRFGRAGVDLQFRKRFAHSRFDPGGEPVREQLLDERVYRE